jgi:YD repeat-containing protein
METATTWTGPPGNGTGTVRYAYDNRGRVSQETDVWGRDITYVYDAAGNRTRLRVSVNAGQTYETMYAYDALNRVTLQSNNKAVKNVVYLYNAAGELTGHGIGGSLTTEYGYDGMGRLTGINYRLSSGNVASFGYAYDDAMNISNVTDFNGTHTYEYDAKSQLTAAAHSAGARETFSYNGIGTNRNGDGTLPPEGIKYRYDRNGDLRIRIDESRQSTGMSVQ